MGIMAVCVPAVFGWTYILFTIRLLYTPPRRVVPNALMDEPRIQPGD